MTQNVMQKRPKASDPIRNVSRLQEIFDLDLVSARHDEALQEFLTEATESLDLPTALVSIVLDEAQYFAAHVGLDGWVAESRGTPVEWSFCTNVVIERRPFVVEDATQHPKTRDNPMVEHEDVRSYAGVPLETSKGEIVGSFCVIGTEPRKFDDNELAYLHALAAKAMHRIESRRRVAPDA